MYKKLAISLVVLEIILVICFCCVGCTHAVASPKQTEVVLRSPDGSIITGVCDQAVRFGSSNYIMVTIDGVNYMTNTMNVLIVEK